MTSSLYELTAEYQLISEYMADPDTTEEELEQALEALDKNGQAFEEKADGYAKLMRGLNAQSEAIKAEVKRLQERKTRIDNNVKRLKLRLQEAMETTGKTKIKTDLFSFNVRSNGVRSIDLDVPVDELPEEFVEVTKKPKNKDILKYIKETGDVSFAHPKKATKSLIIK